LGQRWHWRKINQVSPMRVVPSGQVGLVHRESRSSSVCVYTAPHTLQILITGDVVMPFSLCKPRATTFLHTSMGQEVRTTGTFGQPANIFILSLEHLLLRCQQLGSCIRASVLGQHRHWRKTIQRSLKRVVPSGQLGLVHRCSRSSSERVYTAPHTLQVFMLGAGLIDDDFCKPRATVFLSVFIMGWFGYGNRELQPSSGVVHHPSGHTGEER